MILFLSWAKLPWNRLVNRCYVVACRRKHVHDTPPMLHLLSLKPFSPLLKLGLLNSKLNRWTYFRGSVVKVRGVPHASTTVVLIPLVHLVHFELIGVSGSDVVVIVASWTLERLLVWVQEKAMMFSRSVTLIGFSEGRTHASGRSKPIIRVPRGRFTLSFSLCSWYTSSRGINVLDVCRSNLMLITVELWLFIWKLVDGSSTLQSVEHFWGYNPKPLVHLDVKFGVIFLDHSLLLNVQIIPHLLLLLIGFHIVE